AFYLDFLHKGKDVYPLIDKAIRERPEVYNEEIVRNELYLALGYYVTESSGHNSEYVAWFRKRPDLIEKYCTDGTGWNPGHYAYILHEYQRRKHTWQTEIEEWFQHPVDLARGEEYAAYIFNAIFGDQAMFKFNGNVRNTGLIDNLPEGCCVEVPVLASKRGLEPIHVGPLPRQLGLLCSVSAQIEEMAVEASFTGDRELVYQAVCFDPLTSAVLSLKETRAMVDEMFTQFEDWLPQFQ
ncbi:MAG TPA: alpha-glucosidase/alpha-galactosidase, partial [Clostridia bacterium]|nr:alpha-glucosidase/alpha-galactosidase [Clostridia bacterium]